VPENCYSDYVVYVDESGDHGLKNIDENYPVFVLAFCIFKKQDYIDNIVPNLQKFKFQYFGHDQIILHETDIRRDRGSFSFLKTKDAKISFLNQLTNIINEAPFILISTVIRKIAYRERYHVPENPYHVALGYGLERVFYYLRDNNAHQCRTHVVVEKRGKQEDQELELEFRRICDRENYERAQLPFEVVFADKKSNSAGLQFADLIARPVGLHIIKPDQDNRAFQIIESKFYGGIHRNGKGLKCFP